MNDGRRPLAATLAALVPEWPDDPQVAIRAAVRASGKKVVVLDDDPTGTQTVHGVPVLTTWSVETLQAELRNELPAFYVLTNSRAMPPAAAQALNAEIGRNLVTAAREVGREFVVVSRSDSTLRGHYPGEVEALAEAMSRNFDATLLIPCFHEGGRYTIDDIHYVAEGEWLVPAAETEFARDQAFGYRSSNLHDWVEEKTEGRVPAAQVASITIDDIRMGGPERVRARLSELAHGSVCVVNAASNRDLAVFTLGLLWAEKEGGVYLYRTAASFVPLRSGLEGRPLLTASDLDLPAEGGGLIVVGSYVPRTTGQIGYLLSREGVLGVEVAVERLLVDEHAGDEVTRVAREAEDGLQQGQDVVIYTSRRLVGSDDREASLGIGSRVSKGLVAIVRSITLRPRYVLAKGGITSSDIATAALDVRRALVLGQIRPGVPIWSLGPESRYPGMPYIVFPGNVGTTETVDEIVTDLRPPADRRGP